MVYQFEAKTEKEAIEAAAQELGLAADQFDVEIVEAQRGGLFKKGFVKIEVHTNEPAANAAANAAAAANGAANDYRGSSGNGRRSARGRTERVQGLESGAITAEYDGPPLDADEFEKEICDFITGIVERMGYEAAVTVLFRESKKLGLKLSSHYSSVLIGKKGKTLDALQLVANTYASHLGKRDVHIVLDSENYRLRREESIVRMAYNTADRVRQNHGSLLLEPMNPFERRIVHTTLADTPDIATKSEGEGMYKQVRVMFRNR